MRCVFAKRVRSWSPGSVVDRSCVDQVIWRARAILVELEQYETVPRMSYRRLLSRNCHVTQPSSLMTQGHVISSCAVRVM